MAETAEIEFRVSDVDAPTFRLEGSWTFVNGREVRMLNQAGSPLATLTFDEDPRISEDGKKIGGQVDGLPLLIKFSSRCGCKGTRRIVKG